jgi:hypothetical protein
MWQARAPRLLDTLNSILQNQDYLTGDHSSSTLHLIRLGRDTRS